MPPPKTETASAKEAVSSAQSHGSAIALDDDLAVAVVIAVAIAAATDHDGVVAITILAFTNHFAVAVTVAMTGTDGDADTRRANTNSEFFRTRRHRNGNRGHCDGSHYHMLHHRLLLLDSVIGNAIREQIDRSASTFRIMRSGPMSSQAHAKPECNDDHREHDRRPHRGYQLLRTAAAGRVVGDVV